MISSEVAIIRTLAGVGLSHKKPYCYPSQVTILGLLDQYHDLSISRRTLNRHLSNLEGDGYFERVRRHRRGADGKILFNSTLYKFKGKLFRFMASLGHQAASFFKVFRVPWMAQHQSTPGQGFRPCVPGRGVSPDPGGESGGPSGTSSGDSPPSREENLSRLRELMKKILR
jgi:hypothetical protein